MLIYGRILSLQLHFYVFPSTASHLSTTWGVSSRCQWNLVSTCQWSTLNLRFSFLWSSCPHSYPGEWWSELLDPFPFSWRRCCRPANIRTLSDEALHSALCQVTVFHCQFFWSILPTGSVRRTESHPLWPEDFRILSFCLATLFHCSLKISMLVLIDFYSFLTR